MTEKNLFAPSSSYYARCLCKLLPAAVMLMSLTDCKNIYAEEKMPMSQIVACLESFNKAASDSFEGKSISNSWQKTCNRLLSRVEKLYSEQSPKSFEQIYKSALKNNLSLESETILNYESVDLYNSAIAERNPQLSLNLTGQINSQYFSECSLNNEIQVGIACFTTQRLTPINNPFSYYQIGSIDVPVLNLSYDLINTQQDMLIRSATMTVKQNRSATIQSRKEIVKNVLNASDQLAISMQKLFVREAVVNLYDRSERTVASQTRARFTTRVDLERVRSQLQKSKQERDIALEDINNSFEVLNNILSQLSKSDQTHGLFLSNPFMTVYDVPYPDLVASVLKNSPDINALRFEADALGYDSSAAWKSIWPKLSASVGYSPEIASAIMDNSSIWQSGISQIGATLGLTWSIFDSGLARSRASGYQKRMNSTLLKLEQLTIQKLNLLDQLYKNIDRGNQQLKHSLEAVEQLSMALVGSEQRLNAGFEDITSLIQTVEAFTQSQVDYITALQNQNKRYREFAFTTNHYGFTSISDEIMKMSW